MAAISGCRPCRICRRESARTVEIGDRRQCVDANRLSGCAEISAPGRLHVFVVDLADDLLETSSMVTRPATPPCSS
jgi:hypothetical protein